MFRVLKIYSHVSIEWIKCKLRYGFNSRASAKRLYPPVVGSFILIGPIVNPFKIRQNKEHLDRSG